MELRSKLGQRDYDEIEIEETLETLIAQNFLSDSRFAESYVRSRSARGDGPNKIRHQLRLRGISSTLTDTAFADAGTDWFKNARLQRQKRFGQTPPDDYRERARQSRFLEQRGFSGEHIRAAFDADPD